MSDHYRVLVCWSGIDDAAEGRAETDRRAQAIINAFDRCYLDTTAYSCGQAGQDGYACETVLCFSINHMDLEEMQDLLGSWDWEKPEQVQVLWKSEEMDGYEVSPGVRREVYNKHARFLWPQTVKGRP